MNVSRLIVILSVPVASACGGGGSSPSTPVSPTPQAPTVSGFAITTSGDTLLSGQGAQLTAETTMSDGSRQNVTSQAAWTSDNNTIAAVNSAGQVSALRHGTATVNAAYQGRNAQKLVNVISNFQGTWIGDYNVRVCDSSGVFRAAGWCDSFNPGRTLPISGGWTQNFERVTGTLSLGQLSSTLSGAVSSDGRLTGSAVGNTTSGSLTVSQNIGGVDFRLTTNTAIAGSFAVSWTASGLTGNGYMEGNIRILTRTSSTAAVRRMPLGFLTLEEMLRAALIR